MKTCAPFLFDDFKNTLEKLQEATDRADRYLLLTGESGSGKTSLLRALKERLDRVRYRVVYLHLPGLKPSSFVRCLARSLRVSVGRSQPETAQAISRALREDAGHTLLWLDETQLLPQETFAELTTLSEGDLSGALPFSILLCGLPPLRERLQAPELFPLWRRLLVRLELTGLRTDEARSFTEHHLGEEARRVPDSTLALLFEQARGLPGLLLPYLERTLRDAPEGAIPPEVAETILQRYEMA